MDPWKCGRTIGPNTNARAPPKKAWPQAKVTQTAKIGIVSPDSLDSFSDRELIAESIRRRNPSVPDDTLANVLGKVEEHLQTDEGAKLIVRYAVAEVIESVFGLDERGDYLLAVIEGRAK